MNVIPAPIATTMRDGAPLVVGTGTAVIVQDATLAPSADWLTSTISHVTGIALERRDAGTNAITLSIDETLSPVIATSGTRADATARDGEHYRLTISPDGIEIAGASPEGVFRGVATLVQLISANATGATASLPPVAIDDAPRYAWRGLSFDVVRAFHPVATVQKVIDLLALYKMNVLHLHLTDSEGWRFTVPAYPALTEVSGATARNDRPGGFYTTEDYDHIVRYAAERFVTIVPEFDSPGHTASVLRAYPELAAPGILETQESMHYLHPDQPGVWELVGAVYAEMARVHPGAWLHIGGDEAIAMDEATFGSYMQTAMPMARATGKGIVAWQETARAGFAMDDLMQWWIPPALIERVQEAAANPNASWLTSSFPDPDVREAFMRLFLQAPDDLPKAIEQGADIILSRADKLYLDTKYTEPTADPAQQATHDRVGMSHTVYGSGSVQDAYDWSPASLDPALPGDRIAGIEAAIWCETIEGESDLMFQLLPRLPGVAEKGWSDHRDWDDYAPRLASQRRTWEALSLPYFRSSLVWPEG